MNEHAERSEQLFSAVKSEFKSLDCFYFHNCIYERVWTTSKRRHDNFVNTNDIVCTVPPYGFYTHVGELHYMSYKGTILTKTTFWQRLGDKFRGRLRAWQKRQLFSGIYDHMGKRYIKKIKK